MSLMNVIFVYDNELVIHVTVDHMVCDIFLCSQYFPFLTVLDINYSCRLMTNMSTDTTKVLLDIKYDNLSYQQVKSIYKTHLRFDFIANHRYCMYLFHNKVTRHLTISKFLK